MIRRWVWILLLPAVAAPFVGRPSRHVAKAPRPMIQQPVPAVGEVHSPPPPAALQAEPHLPTRDEVGSALQMMLGITPAVAEDIARRLSERDLEAERMDEERRPALDERVDGEIEAYLFGESLEIYRSMRADGRIAGTAR